LFLPANWNFIPALNVFQNPIDPTNIIISVRFLTVVISVDLSRKDSQEQLSRGLAEAKKKGIVIRLRRSQDVVYQYPIPFTSTMVVRIDPWGSNFSLLPALSIGNPSGHQNLDHLTFRLWFFKVAVFKKIPIEQAAELFHERYGVNLEVEEED
jgi:hypothetical protein